MAKPATEPITELILQDVELALAGIKTTVSATYWNTVRYVERQNAGYPTIRALQRHCRGCAGA